VFNESNGYLSVWHMNGPVKDEVGTLESNDTGNDRDGGDDRPGAALCGQARRFLRDKITNYPSASNPHSSEAWFRPEKPNCTVLAWGNEQAQGKVVMQFRSPPHVTMDCYFSDANVRGRSTLPMSQWIQVVHTYQKGDARVYVDGILDGASKGTGAPLSIKSPARLWIGGWYNNYDFIGDIDEVRISKTVRSADWVRLQYEIRNRCIPSSAPSCNRVAASLFRQRRSPCRRERAPPLPPRLAASEGLLILKTDAGRPSSRGPLPVHF